MAAPEGRELQRRESSHTAYDEDWNPDYASMSLEALQEELQRVRCSAPKLGIADTGRLLKKAGDNVKNLLSPRSSSDRPQQTVSSEKATEAATQIEHLIIPLLRKAGRMKDALEIAQASEASVRAAYGNAHPYTLQSRFLLGTMLHRTNAEEEAQTMHRQVLAARQELLGAAHASTIESMYELALTLQAMGFATMGAERAAKLHEAEMLFRQVRKMLHSDRQPTVEVRARRPIRPAWHSRH